MHLKTRLLFVAVAILVAGPVAYAGNLAPLASPASTTFSAAGAGRSAVTFKFGVNFFGVYGSPARMDFSKLWNGTGGAVNAEDHSSGLMRRLKRSSFGGSYGNLEAWGVYPQVLVAPHYMLVPELPVFGPGGSRPPGRAWWK